TLAFTTQAQINWSADIAPILYENCAKCHRDGGIGHFSLVGFGNAYTYRYDIQDATSSRRMPPWKPDPSYRRYAHENRLTDTEIQRISDWVDAGAPAGDLSAAPPDPVFSDESEVGMPDETLLTPFYTVTATNDEYRCFVIPNGLNQVAYLRGLEALPGNHEVVHHILVYEDTTGQARVLDQQTPNEAGYVNFGGPGVDGARLVGAWVPGAQTALLPPFMGIKLSPGADLIVQMHYPAGVTGMSDQTRINLFFTPGNQGIREVRLAPILNHSPLSLENGPLNIPANEVKEYHAKFTVPQTTSVLAVAPHMHLIGRSIVCFGVTLQNDTIPFIRINEWDFHWQGGYMLQKAQKVPFGTKLHAYAEYDNTPNNPFQPSDPPQTVTQGEATTDEMMLVYFAFTAYQPGDENIVLDSTLLSSSVGLEPSAEGIGGLEVFPNPVKDLLRFQFELTEVADYRVNIVDATGRIVFAQATKSAAAPGLQREEIPVGALAPGVYFIEVQTNRAGVVTERFVKSGE
ncbi:MAG: T9SS type A sorting domain-containing protein, partial [Saprospiraceae bacterium]|nr:T9SS type A sorting domain-containing protein [Saprospiraceae bacterium]